VARRFARVTIAAFTAAVGILGSLPVSFTAAMQQPARTNRVGVLTTGTGSGESDLRESLRDLGYIEGRNVVLEIRETKGRSEDPSALMSSPSSWRV
jgi:hypothetical protein